MTRTASPPSPIPVSQRYVPSERDECVGDARHRAVAGAARDARCRGPAGLSCLDRSLASWRRAALLIATRRGELRRLRAHRRHGRPRRAHDAWLHVDGALGLFARVSPRSAASCGVSASSVRRRAQWFKSRDCGFAFVHDPALCPVVSLVASYLPGMATAPTSEPRPESSSARDPVGVGDLRAVRPARLRVDGEGHLAAHASGRTSRGTDSARAPVQLNIVFLSLPAGRWVDGDESTTSTSHRRGVLTTTGVRRTRCTRPDRVLPAIVNWQTKARRRSSSRSCSRRPRLARAIGTLLKREGG